MSRIQGLVNILDDHGQDTFGTTCLLEQIVCESGRSDVRNMLMFTDGSHLIRIETAHSNAILKRDHGLVSIFSGILLPSSKIVCAALIKINEPPSCDDIFNLHIPRLAMISAIAIAAGMCLQGGEQVDVSRYVVPTASALELKVTLTTASGTLLIYSPGYENQQARFTSQESLGWVPIAEPILCVKAIGGPFEFNIEVIPVEGVD